MTNCTRCQFRNLTNNNICKHKSKTIYYIFDKKCCKYHYSYYGKVYATKIQKVYRGYKCRTNKYFNNVYKHLPDDIQNIVRFYINQDLYYKKYVKTLLKVLVLKILNFIWYMTKNTYRYNTYLFQLRGDDLIEYENFIYKERDNIMYIYNLYFKYESLFNNKNMSLINIKDLNSKLSDDCLHVISYNLKKYKNLLHVSLIYYEKIINNHHTNHVLKLIVRYLIK